MAKRFRSTNARKRAQARFFYHKRRFKEEFRKIKGELSVGKGKSTLKMLPDPQGLSTRGLTTAQIKSEIRELKNLRNREFRKKVNIRAWRDYMNCMKTNEQNKFDAFKKAYGLTPTLEVINSVFNDATFRECNAFLSKRAGDEQPVF